MTKNAVEKRARKKSAQNVCAQMSAQKCKGDVIKLWFLF